MKWNIFCDMRILCFFDETNNCIDFLEVFLIFFLFYVRVNNSQYSFFHKKRFNLLCKHAWKFGKAWAEHNVSSTVILNAQEIDLLVQ